MVSTPSIRSRGINVCYDIPVSRTARFWEALKEGRLQTTRCKTCGKLYFPPVMDCGTCLSSQVEWVELNGEAEIVTFTHVVIRPATFLQSQPYTIAIGKLKEGLKVLAWMTGFKLSEMRVGMKVKLVPKLTDDGNPSYEFTPF